MTSASSPDLRSFRQACGISMAALVARIRDLGVDVHESTISRIERGHHVLSDRHPLRDVWAQALGITADQIRALAARSAEPARGVEALVFDLPQVATMANLSLRYLQDGVAAGRWAHQRQGQGHRIGMTRDQIDALIAAHRVDPAGPDPDSDASRIAAARQATAARLARRAA